MCHGTQQGLCCDAGASMFNCLTLSGDSSLKAAGAGASQGASRLKCAQAPLDEVDNIDDGSGSSDPGKLSPFCCDQMDVMDCGSAAENPQCEVSNH